MAEGDIRMNIIQFKDGCFGIRRTKKFLWFKTHEYLFSTCASHWIDNIAHIVRFKDYDEAVKVFNSVNPEHRVVL